MGVEGCAVTMGGRDAGGFWPRGGWDLGMERAGCAGLGCEAPGGARTLMAGERHSSGGTASARPRPCSCMPEDG